MTAFLFDLDGTLNDSIGLIVQSSRETYAELGIPGTDDDILDTIGVPLLTTGETKLGPGRGQEYLSCYLRHYDANRPLFPTKAYDGSAEMLAELRRAGGKLALVTAKRRDMTRDNLQAIGLIDAFDVIVDFSSTAKHKPDPEPALFALEQLGESADNAWFIGDSVHDLGCALQARIGTVAVLWGAGREKEIAALHPDYMVATMDELCALLLRLQAADQR